MEQLTKQTLFVLVMLLMMIPFLQQQFGLINLQPLKGDIRQPQKPVFSLRDFWQSSYQNKLNPYIEHNIGLRPLLVRINNQLYYSLFRVAFAKGVVVGKSDYLFESDYIHSVYGRDFAGQEQLHQLVDETTIVSRCLDSLQKKLLIVITPGKGSYYPEFIPDHYRTNLSAPTNYSLLKAGFEANNLAFIDVNSWFVRLKNESQFPLFPKSGIHWSHYGMYLALDSILTTMASIQGDDFIDFGYDSIVVSDELRPPDKDIWEGMNLLIEPDDYAMPYPAFYFRDAQKDKMPNVIVVADSFYWQIFGTGYASRVFNKHDFWYYNNTIFPGKGGESRRTKNVDLLEELAAIDFIIILQTEASLNRFGFGFIQDLFQVLQKKYETEKNNY